MNPAKQIVSFLYGAKYFQTFFERVHSSSLRGMNFGLGTDFNESGELAVLKMLRNHFKNEKELVLFDVGANTGSYSLSLAAEFCELPNLSIYAFEPQREIFSKLLETVSANKHIHAFNLGLGLKNESLLIYSSKEHSALTSLYNRDLKHVNLSLSEQSMVDITRLDDFVRDQNIKKIHFLKLDVEGHELAVLGGANKTMENQLIDFIQFEFGGCNIDSRTFFRDFYNLLNDKYQIYRILRNGLRPVHSYSEKLEIFQLSNFLAVRRDLASF